MRFWKHLLIAAVMIAMILAVSACAPRRRRYITPTPQSIVTATTQAGLAASATPVASPTATPLPGPFGPTGFPGNVNPLTGLIVSDPNVLMRRPMLIKISNESIKIRPQTGLSYADHVWEYQMEGYALTRFTAVYFGQAPDKVGSVRSIRLIDMENLVDMYGAILVGSGGSSNHYAPDTPPRTDELLRRQPWANRVISGDYIGLAAYADPYLIRIPDIPRPGMAFEATMFAVPSAIWEYASEKGFNQRPSLDGLLFNYTPPAGGVQTSKVSIDYPGRGPKHNWQYDSASVRWLSSTEDQQQPTPVDTVDMDYLTGKQLGFDNVMIVYAIHFDADYIEDEHEQIPGVHVTLNGTGQCVLLRDGMRYDCIWSRADKGGMMQFVDANNNPLPFKPGTIWFNVASSNVAKPTIEFSP